VNASAPKELCVYRKGGDKGKDAAPSELRGIITLRDSYGVYEKYFTFVYKHFTPTE